MKHFTIGRVALALLATAIVCLSQAAVASAGAPPALSWSSSSGSFDYGTVQAGQTPSLRFRLENEGGSASEALKVTLSGSSAFTITSDTCSGTSLGPEKSCRVTVKYTPATGSDSAVLTARSKKASATATLTGSKQSEPQSQIDCPAFGGTYATGAGTPTLWTCNGFTDSVPPIGLGPNGLKLEGDCNAEGGVFRASLVAENTWNGTCINPL